MYIFFWFFKQLYYILKRFKLKNFLLLLAFFVIAFFLFIKPSFALSDLYGNYHGFSASDINSINTLISQNKENYDSFLCRFYRNNDNSQSLITIWFYNYNELGGLYKSDNLNTAYPYLSFNVFSKYSKTNGAKYCSYNYSDFSFINTGYRDTLSNVGVSNNTGNSSDFMIYTNRNIYSNSALTNLFFNGGDITILSPYITTDSSSIINWTFSNLTINGANLSSDYSHSLRYTYPNSNTSYEFNIDNYYTIVNNTLIFNIPRSIINEDIVVRNGSIINFSIISRQTLEGGQSLLVNDLGAYTLDLTAQAQQEINEDSDKQLLSDIKQEQQQTTQAVENLENTITDSNVDNSSIDLPTDTTTDITRDGLNNIFTMLYNAFCTGTAQDIVFPIPFTNKNITIQPNYLHDMLYNYTGTWLLNIIEAFYWYVISRFIIKDIVSKINKIKSGNLEDIENSNIKGDML